MREGTIVGLINSDVAARHRDEHGIRWMSLDRLERLRKAEARSYRDLPLKQYAALLCEAIRDYDFPAVTYDFTEEKPLHHDNMLAVEQYIDTLLRSKDVSAVKDGLSNVLYWGYARQPRLRDFRVSDFRKTIPDPEREPKLDQFAQLIRSGQADLLKNRFLTQMCARFSPSRSAAPWEEGADALVPANQRCSRLSLSRRPPARAPLLVEGLLGEQPVPPQGAEALALTGRRTMKTRGARPRLSPRFYRWAEPSLTV